MKKIILIILTIIALAGLTSCKKQEGTAEKNAHSNADAIIDETQNELLEETAQEAAKAFTNGNMNDINKIVFGTTQINANDKLSEIWGENTSAQEGVLNGIFELVTLKVKKITASTIEYEIEAPDMSEVFLNIDAANISESRMAEQIKTYTLEAENKVSTVSLEYVLVNGEPVINYQEEEFINAVTGGLLNAYKTLYSEMMEEYAEGVGLK